MGLGGCLRRETGGRVVTQPGNNAQQDKARALCRCGGKGTYSRTKIFRMEPEHDCLRVVNSADRMATDGVMCRAFETLHRRCRLSDNQIRENLKCGSRRRTSAVCERVNGMLTAMRRTLTETQGESNE